MRSLRDYECHGGICKFVWALLEPVIVRKPFLLLILLLGSKVPNYLVFSDSVIGTVIMVLGRYLI